MPNLTRAMWIASQAHGLQCRKGNREPYIYHVIRVADMVREAGEPQVVQIAALLHDVVEDTDWTFEAIEKEFPFWLHDPEARSGLRLRQGMINMLVALTKKEGQNKVEAVEQLRHPDVPQEAIAIKMADRIDNLRDGEEAFDFKWMKKQLPSTERLLEIAKERGYEGSLLFSKLSERVSEIKPVLMRVHTL